jgi:hypothetical protein
MIWRCSRRKGGSRRGSRRCPDWSGRVAGVKLGGTVATLGFPNTGLQGFAAQTFEQE